ncbi:MAG: TIGR01777 family oxidoreductase [Verrucomicrobiia bacterium]|jgi:uncharacterized protein (TIGR01777 family)
MNATQNKKIILAGGTGFLGKTLARHFRKLDWNVTILTRGAERRENGVSFIHWDGESIGPWTSELEGATAVVNLAGRSVDCRYHARNRRLILDSRVNSTRILGKAIASCDTPPPVWLNSSTATIYRRSLDKPMDEASGKIGGTREAKDIFSVEVAVAWEKAFDETQTPDTRKVALRSAMVLGNYRNSVLPVLRRLTRLGLGGKMASGRQFVSWIHEIDFCRAIEWLIYNETVSGIVNLAAPNPLPNRDMTGILRRVCRAPFGLGLPAPLWLLELGAFFLRTETELIIKSRRVVPGRLSSAGFKFHFTQFEAAASEIEDRIRNTD